NLVKEKDQYRLIHSTLPREKDQLQQRVKELSTSRTGKSRKASGYNEVLMDFTFIRSAFPLNTLQNCAFLTSLMIIGSLYQVSSTKKTWDQSRSDCRQKGADLLIINSEEEQAFANRFQKYMWIGLTDVTNEGSWKWVDGTAMSTRLLSLIRGLTLVAKNCVDIKNFNAEKSWNDESCSLSLLWICEKKLFQ
uniref:C-type lectin domain-containing protein n=1 Tax=Takifugu rubripes TaxID=31033 RepID=A0A674N5Y1_TAKRU